MLFKTAPGERANAQPQGLTISILSSGGLAMASLDSIAAPIPIVTAGRVI
jgi:hypothetical protein